MNALTRTALNDIDSDLSREELEPIHGGGFFLFALLGCGSGDEKEDKKEDKIDKKETCGLYAGNYTICTDEDGETTIYDQNGKEMSLP